MVWGEWERKEAELISPPNLSQSKGIFCRIIIMSALLGFTMKGECISNFTWFTGEEDRKSRNSWKSGKIELIPRLPACVLYSATEIAEPLTAIIVHDLYFSLYNLIFREIQKALILETVEVTAEYTNFCVRVDFDVLGWFTTRRGLLIWPHLFVPCTAHLLLSQVSQCAVPSSWLFNS